VVDDEGIFLPEAIEV